MTALDRHMMNVYLELGQLWGCPVEWCTVWKGSVSDCLGHLHEKHGGSQYVALKNLGKFFPPRTVPRDIWQTVLRPDVSGVAVDVRLFHESGCRMVHKYRVYRDPFPHPALRGRVMNKLLALVARAMAIAELTQLHITIPAAGSGGEPVLEECFPSIPLPRVSAVPCRVSFASEVAVLGVSPESRSVAKSDAGGPAGYSDSRTGLSVVSRRGYHERFYCKPGLSVSPSTTGIRVLCMENPRS